MLGSAASGAKNAAQPATATTLPLYNLTRTTHTRMQIKKHTTLDSSVLSAMMLELINTRKEMCFAPPGLSKIV
jgi:hypothetical protein